MLLFELKAAIQSRIWDIMHENSWRELDDFSIILSDKISRKMITGSKPKILPILKQVKTSFFRINKVSKEYFAAELSLQLDYLVKLFGSPVKRKMGKKEKAGKRKDFSDDDKRETLRKQDHLCANCGRLLNVVDYDHIDGDRTNNHMSNCQALCPYCHAIKTRRNQTMPKK